MQVIIPVGGRGSRLRPLTHSVPKPLLHVAGRPVLDWIFDKVKTAEVSEVIFVLGNHSQEVYKEYAKTLPWPVKFAVQEYPDGPAGAIKMAEPFIKEPVLIIYADTIFDVDLNIKDEDAIIWCKEVEDYQRFGVVVHENRIMTKIVEKPSEPISKLANIGLYYVKDYKLMFESIHWLYDNSMKVKGEYFLPHAFQRMVDLGKKFHVADVKEWLDCGKFETVLETNETLLKRSHEVKGSIENSQIIEPVYIEQGCEIKNSIIGPNVSISKGAKVKNSIINDSIIGISAEVKGQMLKESIIGNRARISRDHSKIYLGDDSSLE